MTESYEARWRAPGDVGVTLDQARRSKGLTQAQLAERVRMTQSTISLMESGAPTRYLSRLFEIARTLGLDIRVRWDDAPLPPVNPDPWAFLTVLDGNGSAGNSDAPRPAGNKEAPHAPGH